MRRILFVLLSFAVGAGCSRSSSSSSTGAGSTVAPATSRTTPAATAAPPTPLPPPGPARAKTARVIARAGEGFLEDQNGRHLLHVKGSAYERGRQYGELLGDEIEDILQRLYGYAQQYHIPSFVVPIVPPLVAPLYKPYFPPDVLESLRGFVDGAARRSPPVQVTLDELIFMNAIIDIGAMANLPIFKCSGHAVWGPRTKGGKMFQLRNVDLLVGSGLESHAVAVIEKPDNGYAFLNAGWTGMLGSASGMNEHGLGISQVWAFSWDSNLGQPWVLTNRGLLATAENTDAVRPAFAAVQRTYGSNFVFADRGDGRNGKPQAVALESTNADLASFVDADPLEDASIQGFDLCIRMPFAVMRGDTPMCQRIRLRQYIHPDPRGAGGYEKRYKQQADMTKAYEAKGVLMGADEMIAISRQIAMPGSSLQCVVYENSDLVVHVANSRVTAPGQAIDANTEPFEAYDLDYYLPTIAAKPDKASYALGDTIQLALTVGNHGRDRKLEARATLVALPGGTKTTFTQRAAFTAPTGQAPTGSLALVIPSTAVTGPCELVVELLEANSDDVVDYARCEVTVK